MQEFECVEAACAQAAKRYLNNLVQPGAGVDQWAHLPIALNTAADVRRFFHCVCGIRDCLD